MANATHPATPDDVITAVGVGYISVAVITIPLHIICSLLMWQDKEMRNPTYQFIINLSVADVLELIPLGIYAGLILVFRLPLNYYLQRFMSFWCLSAWYANCVLFALIAFSRWIAMTRNYLVHRIFTRRNLRLMHIVPWVIICVFYLYSTCLHPSPTFFFMPQFFTWGFDMHLPFGEYLHWHNFVFNTGCAIVEMWFNVLSLNWVRKTRKTIQSVATTENQRRETKLLIQCFVIGCVFTLASVMFTIVFAAGLDTPMAYLCMQSLWTFNHCVNPLVYLSVNSKLRRALIRRVTCGRFGKHNKVKSIAIPAASVFPGSRQSGPGSMVNSMGRMTALENE